jgi:hypothetical protein
VSKANRVLAEIALARREWAEADAALRTALHVAESIGEPTQIWKTHVVCARVARARGDGDAASQAMHAAAAVLETLKSDVRNTELLSSLRANVKLPADIA